MASRMRTHSTLTVQKDVRSHTVACSGILAGTHHRRDGSLESPQHLAHADLARVAGQLVPAPGAARAAHELGIAEADHELLQVGARQILRDGDLGEAGRAAAVVGRELHHQADAVFALG